jgi:hypothetical protein
MFPESGSRSRLFIKSGSGSRSRFLMLKDQKNFDGKISTFLIRNCNIFIFTFHEGLSSYRRSLRPSKENIQHLKT